MEPLSGCVDVAARGESIPFVDESFELVLCTQVLEHVSRPSDVVTELHRVLKPGGIAFISVPAVFPIHGAPADNWRFMAGGLQLLLSPFEEVRITAEAGTVAGFFRTINMYAWLLTGRRRAGLLRWLAQTLFFPFSNLLGYYLERWLRSGDQFGVNWLAVARK
jgi:2-polyprenyl-3-methyl-5-hydroxy-6-metoxy-1,4-benzoquinol methylase